MYLYLPFLMGYTKKKGRILRLFIKQILQVFWKTFKILLDYQFNKSYSIVK
jgi:hypothetical protein